MYLEVQLYAVAHPILDFEVPKLAERVLEEESMRRNPGIGILELESWKRNPARGIVEEESLRWKPREKSWQRKQGDGFLGEESQENARLRIREEGTQKDSLTISN